MIEYPYKEESAFLCLKLLHILWLNYAEQSNQRFLE